MENKPYKCPYCGGTEFIVGEQSGFANVHVKKVFQFKETPLYHQICKVCGTVVRTYVEDAHTLDGS